MGWHFCDSVAWYSHDDRAGCDALHLMTIHGLIVSPRRYHGHHQTNSLPYASTLCSSKMPLLLQYVWQSMVSHRHFQRKPCINNIQLQLVEHPGSTPHPAPTQSRSRDETAFYNRNSFWVTITSILAVLGGLAFFLAQKPYWDWTAQKDFLEYCQSLSVSLPTHGRVIELIFKQNVNQNATKSCDRALTIPLPPPPFSRIQVTRRIVDGLPAIRPPHGDTHPSILSQKGRFHTSSRLLEVTVVFLFLLALAILVFRRAKIHLFACKLKRNLLVIRSTPVVGSDEERVLESLGQSTPFRPRPASHTTTLGTELYSFPRRRAVADRELYTFRAAADIAVFDCTDSIPSLFPLLVSDFEDYQHSFKHLPPSRLKRVSNKLSSLKRAVKGEEGRFMNTVQHMTQAMASAEYSGNVTFVVDSVHTANLRSRFGSVYPIYENKIKYLKQLMGELHELFSSKSGQVSPLHTNPSSTFNRQILGLLDCQRRSYIAQGLGKEIYERFARCAKKNRPSKRAQPKDFRAG